jgi:hypothetical protein
MYSGTLLEFEKYIATSFREHRRSKPEGSYKRGDGVWIEFKFAAFGCNSGPSSTKQRAYGPVKVWNFLNSRGNINI